jgi:hypothetical protein
MNCGFSAVAGVDIEEGGFAESNEMEEAVRTTMQGGALNV